MSVFALTSDQKETLSKWGQEFRNWLNTEKGRNTITEHREHEKYFKEKLSSQNLTELIGFMTTDLSFLIGFPLISLENEVFSFLGLPFC